MTVLSRKRSWMPSFYEGSIGIGTSKSTFDSWNDGVLYQSAQGHPRQNSLGLHECYTSRDESGPAQYRVLDV